MGLNDTASSERLHIAFFGLRNAGKSSLVNAVTGQELSVVSEVKGTTTDPVKKAMELLPLGPVVIIDTPGLDDEGALGEKRVEKAQRILGQTDIAVLVVDAVLGLSQGDREILRAFEERKLPYLIAMNKAELTRERKAEEHTLYVSALTGEGIELLKNRLGEFARLRKPPRQLVSDLLPPASHVLLVAPIDASAPKGRLILPQQQTIRELLDGHCTLSLCQPEELPGLLRSAGRPPELVITDSQVFSRVAALVPEPIMLTSFSILFARYKGELATLVEGASRLAELKQGDRVLISEGCTHHRQCNDIGTVKLPQWIAAYSGVQPDFRFTSGGDFPGELSGFSLIVHCGGCMLNEAEMRHRLALCRAAGVPVVNYGVAIACLQGVLRRALSPFPALQARLQA